ncbi:MULTISPECIES: DUF2946 domain-containing protein [unclassified Klebsiella]|uniref:DUF2946 domain-containing protein n=1 Tax=Enterobacteriaceae TaxID=543 RepID=UPI0015DC445E|nr:MULTISPECIES: DUF2946 domain-containing protein [unclassified Klebsiella]BBR60039.1 hypothetical protein WP4W18E05_34070 [Klebsiella sp. WP4-W18-ESBL-05]BBS90626.1 hypothetical protein WP7S18C02_12410 [Klebsiella sp. WP7-S18-CRE-02]BBS95649.1 hypothetical protein WP7S18C03_12420 [Klebsiella sp. WP7-S18-CRE-03]BBT00679.1 hypothetical protein WP7S18E04_12410 [Klebsiella sp. WP7-S18-ESBL-04]
MNGKITHIIAFKRRAAWLALFAMALIVFAPLVSISLQPTAMSAMPGMHHEMSMPMLAHHSVPQNMPVDHGEACGYCVLLTHVPGMILALCVLLCALLLRVNVVPFLPTISHWHFFPWLFPDTRAPPRESALPA